MITKIRVKGFKAIYDSKNISLSPFTVFVGRNGSGKSSILESLQWLQESMENGLQAATERRFRVFSDLCNRRTDRISIELDFRRRSRLEVQYKLAVKAGPHGTPLVTDEKCGQGKTKGYLSEIKKISPSRRDILSSTGKKGNIETSLRDTDTLALSRVKGTNAFGARQLTKFLHNAVFLRLNPVHLAQPGQLLLPVKGPRMDEEGTNLPALLNSLDADQKRLVLQRLQECLGHCAKVVDVNVKKSDVTQQGVLALDEKMLSRGGTKVFTLPAWVLSEGTRRLTALFALLAMEPRPSLLAIEEIENGLDPWTLSYLLAALRQAADEGVQVILTSHSPYFLNQIDADEIIHVRRHDGDSQYKPITEYREVAAYEGKLSPGVMYISDYFKDKE